MILRADLTLSVSLEGKDLLDLLTFLKEKKPLNAKLTKNEEPPKEPPIPKYRPDPSSLIDIVCRKPKVLHALFAVLSKVTQKVTLYFSQAGIVCRIVTNDKKVMVDLHISNALFDIFHVKDHVKVSLSPGLIHSSIKVADRQDFHLQAFDKARTIMIGKLDFERTTSIDPIERSEKPFPGEEALPDAASEATASLPFHLFDQIVDGMSRWRIGAIQFESDSLTFSSGSEDYRFSKVIKSGENVNIRCKKPVVVSCDTWDLDALLDRRFNIASSLLVSIHDAAICYEPVIDGVHLSYYTATHKDTVHTEPCMLTETRATGPIPS